jgi:uncharacterized protein YdhG (YjbR/CyaY superfamily)
MQSKAATVDAYLAEVPADRAAALATLRTHIRAAAPAVEEDMRYGLPTYLLDDEMFCAMASQKQNLALYVANTRLVEQFGPRLGASSIGKCCIRFRRLTQLSLPDVDQLLGEAYRRALAKGRPSAP